MTPQIAIPQKEIAGFCRKHNIRKLSLFGSVLRDDFGPDSDIDVLVEFDPEVKYGLFDMVRIQDELAAIIGRPVDLLERSGVETSENYIRRKHILSSAETVYVAR